ncbi:hypothetical protein CWI39_1716p0010 [Hamiltosporidium magnivora]|uniref:Uncharacterized protein n=1 Tax=Hamiltosporidium magnivora TaxID=148818 RepID=A0A4Q9KZ79_9MICR|nr:hypothetical protein CWI39_1716p0010 [Hamiltosporidium magnivora]
MKKNIIHAIKEYVIVFFYLQTIFSGTHSTNNFSCNSNDISQNTSVSNKNSQIPGQKNGEILNAKRKNTGSAACSEPETLFKSSQKKLKSDGISKHTFRGNHSAYELAPSNQSNPGLTKNNISNNKQNNENHDVSDKKRINKAMICTNTFRSPEPYNKSLYLTTKEPSSPYNMFHNKDSKTNEISDTESTLLSKIPVKNSTFIPPNPEINNVANLSNQNDEISGFLDCKRLVSNLENISKNLQFAITYLNVLNSSVSDETRNTKFDSLNKQAQDLSIDVKCKNFYISTLTSWNLVIKELKYQKNHPYLNSLYCFLKESRDSSKRASDYLRKMCYWRLIDSYLKKEINSLNGIKLLGNYDNMTDIDILTIEFLGVTQILCRNRFLAFIKSYREDEEIETFAILLKYSGNFYWYDIYMLKTCLSENELAINSFIKHLNLQTYILELQLDGDNDNPEDGNTQLKKNLQIFRDKFNEIYQKILNISKIWPLNNTI